jgi:peptidyl-prolyl cis-trans isomerase C
MFVRACVHCFSPIFSIQWFLTPIRPRVSVARTLRTEPNDSSMTYQKEFMKIRVVFATFIIVAAVAGRVLAAEKPKSATPPIAKSAPVATSAAVAGEVVVARVNGSEINRKELDAAVQALAMQMAQRGRQVPPGATAQLQHDVLEEMIGRELLLQEGSKHVPADVDQKAQAQIEMVKKQLGGEERLKETLVESGVTFDEYAKRVRNNVIVQETIRQLVDKEVKIAPEEVKSFYDKNPEQFKQPETARASHILIRVAPDASDDVKKEKRAQIEAARSLVKNGAKFADVAKKVSEDPGSAANGGDLGFFPRGKMVPEFDTAAFSLKTNELSNIITTQFGYHVLLVTDRKPAQTASFDQVKDELGQFLKQRKGNEAVRDHVTELRKTAKVEMLLPALPSAPTVETPPVPAPAK